MESSMLLRTLSDGTSDVGSQPFAPSSPSAVARLKTGRAAEAMRTQEDNSLLARELPRLQPRFASPPWMIGGVASVKAHYWLGVAYEQDGRKADAVRKYEEFLNIWRMPISSHRNWMMARAVRKS